MMLAARPDSTAADLMRLVCAWLAACLLVQGLAAGLALGAGPLHEHAAPSSARAHDAHHHHDGAERHHHRADDGSVVEDAASALDQAALALVAALALLAFATAHALTDPRRHMRPLALPAAWRSTTTPPLLRPPQRA